MFGSSGNERKLALLGLGALFFLTALWLLFCVPITADEANIFHILACRDYPFAHFNIFSNNCNGHDNLKVLFGGITLVKPYVYGGMLPAILYAPFYYLFHTPVAQGWFGLLFFFAFAIMLSRETRKPLLSFAFILAFFPFAFQFIHDMGPIKYAFLVFPLCAIGMRGILVTQVPKGCVWAILLSFIIICAVEDKAFFLYLLPSLVFFCLALSVGEELRPLIRRLKEKWKLIALTIFLTLLGIGALLFSTNADGEYYLHSLINFMNTVQQTDMPLEARGRNATQVLQYLFIFLLLWPAYAHRIYDVFNTYYDIWGQDPAINAALTGLTAAFIVLCIYMGLRQKAFSWRPSPRTALLSLSFFATVVVFLGIRNVWAGHHFIFLWIPLAVLFLDFIGELESGQLAVVAVVYILLNVSSVYTLTQAKVLPDDLSDRDVIFAHFSDAERARQSIVNYSSWGGYNIHSLYGPKDQLVTYTDPLTPAKANALLEIAQQTGRRIYDVCVDTGGGKMSLLHSCSKESLEHIFGDRVTFQQRLPELPVWRVFEGHIK